jgi:hypothetical protein
VSDVIVLAGMIAPAAVRSAPLLEQPDGINAIARDLKVCADQEVRSEHSIESELAGLAATAGRAGFERFHLYSHSGGGASAAAFSSRLVSLGVGRKCP